MKIKRVIAPTMPEAMKMIKDELGQDAIILNSKEIRTGGFLGFFTKPNVVVIAASDPTPPKLEKNKEFIKPPQPGLSNHNVIEDVKVKQDLEDIRKAVDQLKENTFEGDSSDMPKGVKDILFQLKKQGVLQKQIKTIERKLIKEWHKHDEKLSPTDLKEMSYQFLINMLSDRSFNAYNDEMKMINLVGPTGVGKTTTLAKLASKAVLDQQKKVALITTDTYRIAAIEQLRTYADLLDVPLKVSYTIEDFKEAINLFHDYDLILIDSAGRNYQNTAYIQELKETIYFSKDMVTYLVLSATSKLEDMKAIFHQFSEVPLNQLIITKVDETRTFGPIFDLLCDNQIGISYMTNGQNVPDDIYEASTDDIISKLLGANNNG